MGSNPTLSAARAPHRASSAAKCRRSAACGSGPFPPCPPPARIPLREQKPVGRLSEVCSKRCTRRVRAVRSGVALLGKLHARGLRLPFRIPPQGAGGRVEHPPGAPELTAPWAPSREPCGIARSGASAHGSSTRAPRREPISGSRVVLGRVNVVVAYWPRAEHFARIGRSLFVLFRRGREGGRHV